jgi:hypothetical protein
MAVKRTLFLAIIFSASSYQMIDDVRLLADGLRALPIATGHPRARWRRQKAHRDDSVLFS